VLSIILIFFFARGKILYNISMTRNEDCFMYIKKYSIAARTVFTYRTRVLKL